MASVIAHKTEMHPRQPVALITSTTHPTHPIHTPQTTGTLSLSPSLHSGMPLRYVRILSAPTTSERTTLPLLLTRRLTDSTTSKNTSFFL